MIDTSALVALLEKEETACVGGDFSQTDVRAVPCS
jgi:uncharacterized protein with PIN domain